MKRCSECKNNRINDGNEFGICFDCHSRMACALPNQELLFDDVKNLKESLEKEQKKDMISTF